MHLGKTLIQAKIKFSIKKGIKWHDGNELTIDDWIYSLNVLADKDYNGNYYPVVENIEGSKENMKAKQIQLVVLKSR